MKTFEKRTGRFVPGRTNIQTGDIIKFKRYFTQIKFELYLCRGENELTAEEYIKSSYSESEAEDLVFLIAQITVLTPTPHVGHVGFFLTKRGKKYNIKQCKT